MPLPQFHALTSHALAWLFSWPSEWPPVVEWVGFAVVQLIVKAAAQLVICPAMNAAENPVAVINEPDPQLPATLFDDGRLRQGTPVFNPQAKTGKRADEQLRVLLAVIGAV